MKADRSAAKVTALRGHRLRDFDIDKAAYKYTDDEPLLI
jgi:hypothetical protein